jgi:AraC-like DNA-binding protein
MQFLDITIRVCGVTLLLLQAALLIAYARDVRPARFGALMAVGLAGVMIVDTPLSAAIPAGLRLLVLALSMNSAIFIWWFTRSLLDDDFRLGGLEWGIAAAWFALGSQNLLGFAQAEPVSNLWAAYARTAMAVGIAAHIVYIAIAGRSADLVEARRRVRAYLAVTIAALFLIDLGTELVFGYLNVPLWLSTLQAATFLTVIVWTICWLLRLDKSVLMFERHETPQAVTEPALSPKEQRLHARLAELMDKERAYLEPELSIGALAERIGAPEHQLRSLINKAMGWRNFRAFLNSYRMEAIKQDLADPEKAALPILTIAMDGGFASLSSFNRAFKEATGKTPSQWRDDALNRKPADQN